jgi:hypothetical protein
MRLDVATMTEAMTAAIRVNGVIQTWDSLICPVLVGIGERHAETKRLIEVEHLLSRSISEVLAAVPRSSSWPAARILLTCAEEEQHSLPIEALAAALAERSYPSRLFGARVPIAALVDAVRRVGPSFVLVWSQTSETAHVKQLRSLLAVRPRPAVIAASGPGWIGRNVPRGIEQPADLAEALASATAVAGP